MRPLHKINLTLTLLVIFGLAFAMPVLAATAEQILGGFEKTGTGAGFDVNSDGAPKREFVDAFSDYATGLAAILGALFMLLVIYGGWLWMSARGNEQQVEQARGIILGAVIGIVIVISARIIVEVSLVALGRTVITGS